MALLACGCASGPDPALGEWVCIDRRLAPLPIDPSTDTGAFADTGADPAVDTGPGAVLGATRQACPVDGVTWQLDLRGANPAVAPGFPSEEDEPGEEPSVTNPGAVFSAVSVVSGTFESVELRATPGAPVDPGTWTLTPLIPAEPAADGPPFADLQLACTLRTPDDLGVRILHCAGSHTAFDEASTASLETWDLRLARVP